MSLIVELKFSMFIPEVSSVESLNNMETPNPSFSTQVIMINAKCFPGGLQNIVKILLFVYVL